MTPVALDMSQIHLGKGQGASGRHQECLHSLLENRRVVSAWVYIVHWPLLASPQFLRSPHKERTSSVLSIRLSEIINLNKSSVRLKYDLT